MPAAYHTVHYRKFGVTPVGTSAETLEKMGRTALGADDMAGRSLWQRVTDRMYNLADESNRQILLNRAADLTSAVVGEMVLVEQKGLQALLELKPSNIETSSITTAEIYNLSERGAPRGSQFIRGIVYWLAISNHLFFVRLQSMSSDQMSAYLSWLLRAELSALGGDVATSLQAAFDLSAIPGGSVGDIRSLKVSGKAAPQFTATPGVVNEGEKTVSTSRRVMAKLVQSALAVPVVRALIGDDDTKSLVASLGPNEYLAVDAQVRVQGQRTEKSRAKMRELATSLADTAEGEIKVEGKDGQISKGDVILRTRMPFEVAHEGSNYLDFFNAADQLQEVCQRFVKDKKIDA